MGLLTAGHSFASDARVNQLKQLRQDRFQTQIEDIANGDVAVGRDLQVTANPGTNCTDFNTSFAE